MNAAEITRENPHRRGQVRLEGRHSEGEEGGEGDKGTPTGYGVKDPRREAR